MGGSYRPDYSAGRPQHVRPARSASPARSPKRRRGDDLAGRGQTEKRSIYRDYRDRSPDAHTVFVRSSPPPGKESNPDISRQPRQQQRNYAPSTRSQHSSMEPQQHNRNSTSSRARSLRKLLDGPSNLPPPIRQEKERELASLLLDQEKARSAKQKRKQTGKYHFVRFVERQKAERNLKSLEKQLKAHRDESPEKEGGPEEVRLVKEIDIAKVDIAYTLYTPLNSKYVSLFPHKDPAPSDKVAGISKADRARMTPEELNEILKQRDENMDIIRNAGGEKPPAWSAVEKLMGNSAALERLRDGGTHSWSAGAEMTVGIVGGKKDSQNESRPGWMDDDGAINPEDLDSNSGSDGGVDLKMADLESSDGEFFE